MTAAIGSLTIRAAITQLLPYSAFARPGAEPSWNPPAAYTFFRAAEQRVIDPDRDRLPGRDQQRHNLGRDDHTSWSPSTGCTARNWLRTG